MTRKPMSKGPGPDAGEAPAAAGPGGGYGGPSDRQYCLLSESTLS